MEIIKFKPEYKKYFIEYNTDWIVDYFGSVEDADKKTFNTIEESIADGGMIYFAVKNDTVLACCMTKPMHDGKGSWEICKLASNKHTNHRGAGEAVFKACMNWAENHGAKRLFILSNSRLKAAMHIYDKFGFNEIKLEDYEYERGNIAFEYIIKNKKSKRTVCKKEDAEKRIFKGVSLDSLAVGEKSIVCKMNYAAGDFASEHKHPHEQSGYVISGKYHMTIDDQEYDLSSGDSYAIPGNTPHSFRVIEAGEVIDVFTPIREDYI